ncbi:MAG TPA: SlyX family protein [Rhodocyclaceae bacterium]|jgi:SlyX protein|nr:SlyX family protein [Rhodocyclaceae bacterium]
MSLEARVEELEVKLTERICELEVKFAWSEDLLDTLNTTVFRQQQHIDLLQEQLRALRQQFKEAMPAAEQGNLRDEIPPHY